MAIQVEAPGLITSQSFKINEIKRGTVFNVPELPADNVSLASFIKQETETKKSLLQFENSYKALMESIDLKKFDPANIDQYIQQAERRRGTQYTEQERLQFQEAAKTEDPEILKSLALEFGVGIPEKEEKEALVALGKLLLHREDETAMKNFLTLPDKDPNLKWYVRTILTMNRLETLREKFEGWKRKFKFLDRFSDRLGFILPIFSDN